MGDDDLIRRGDALALFKSYDWSGSWLAPIMKGKADAISALPAVTVGVKDFDVEVVRGNTGGNLALYFNDHRVAGSKPWGGGTTIHKFRVQGDDAKSAGILATIRDFQTVPHVKECLTTDAALPAVTVDAPDACAEALSDMARDDAPLIRAILPAPDAAAIREAVHYELHWIAAARPPAHPEPMKGSQTFPTERAALEFFDRKPKDSKFLRLVKIETRRTLLTEKPHDRA